MLTALVRCCRRPSTRSVLSSRSFTSTIASPLSASTSTRDATANSDPKQSNDSLSERLRQKRAHSSDWPKASPPHLSSSTPPPANLAIPTSKQIDETIGRQSKYDQHLSNMREATKVRRAIERRERKNAFDAVKMGVRRRQAKSGAHVRQRLAAKAEAEGEDKVPPRIRGKGRAVAARKITVNQDFDRRVEAATKTGLLSQEQTRDLQDKVTQLKALRELNMPWVDLHSQVRYNQVGLAKAKLIREQAQKQAEAGQIPSASDASLLIEAFGLRVPSTSSTSSTTPDSFETPASASSTFETILPEANAPTAPPINPSPAAATPVPSAEDEIDPKSKLANVLRVADHKIRAATRDSWPERLAEIAQEQRDLQSLIGAIAAQTLRDHRRQSPASSEGTTPRGPPPPAKPLVTGQSVMEQMATSLRLGKDQRTAAKERKEGETGRKGREGQHHPEVQGEVRIGETSLQDSGKGRRPRGTRVQENVEQALETGPSISHTSPREATYPARPPHLPTRHQNHPALRPSPPEPAFTEPLRELSSYSHVLSASTTPFAPVPPPFTAPIATLSHSLERVLFNPGVHFLRDPRTGVYNFDPETLENVPKVEEFEFDKLPQYVTSSKDEVLKGLAESEGKMFVGSTSSTVGMLCQIYFWLSSGKEVNTSMLSAVWQEQNRGFSMGQQIPVSVVLNYEDGRYAIDADKSFDKSGNILSDYGHLMEKLLTTPAEEFKRFLVDSEDPAPSEAGERQAYHYAATDHLILRSQLDAHNNHLPNKTFDLKTRGTVAIRQDRLNYVESSGYTIDRLRGPWESFEREYYDLIRSAFLKYQFQARIGHMDGILVAYHSTARFYGFQYLPVSEMDEALFDNSETGNQVFKLSLGVLETVLKEAVACYPGESVNVTWAASESRDVLRVFVSPQGRVAETRAGQKEDGVTTEVGVDGDAEGRTEAGDKVDSPLPAAKVDGKLPMTLLELRGTNFLDGEAKHGPFAVWPRRCYPDEPGVASPPSTVPASSCEGQPHPDSSASSALSASRSSQLHIPVWQLGFDITKSTGQDLDPSNPSPVSADRIATLFADVRAFQTMFSSLALPTGVTPQDVAEAARRAEEAGVELDPSDLSLQFPLGDGIKYRTPSRTVKELRQKARAGARRRIREEQRYAEQTKQPGNRVQVISNIEVVEP
ncbi:hypothetical protein JCM11641_007413 [Rhodosporidiobolus odoratus]